MRRDRSTARHTHIRRLVATRQIASQKELQELLAAAGHHVSQATISRDLMELGATRIDDRCGPRYHLGTGPGHRDGRHRLRRALSDYLEAILASGNLVVVKVTPATAAAVAAAIDNTRIEGVIGTVAGDDTVLVVTADPDGGPRIANLLTTLLEA